MKYGQELIEQLEKEIELMKAAIANRIDRINACETDWDDCFISQRCEERGIRNNRDKIDLIKDGGCAWFIDYATLDNQLVNWKWCKTQYGYSLRVVMPDGNVVWTTAHTAKGLAKKGLKKVECKRPAWFKFSCSGSGMLGVYTGDYVLFPSDVNYATGEAAGDDPIEIKDVED
ncbi:hypothetical protein ACPA0F_08920 [Solibacillus silvestris]